MKQDLALFFSCYMTVSPLTLSWHFWGELFVKSKYYFSSSWCFLSIVTPWFVSNADNTNLNINILKTYFLRFLTTSEDQLFRRAPFDGCFWQYVWVIAICQFSEKNWLSQKTRVCLLVYSLLEIRSNIDYINSFINCRG